MADSRINLYHNLSVMLNAGVPVTRALQQACKGGKYGRLFEQIQQDVAHGSGLAEAVGKYEKHFAPLDITLVRVGEETGQTAEMFEALAQWYAFRGRLMSVMRMGLFLPVFYVHAAAFLLPVVPFALGGWDWGTYFRGMFGILVLAYVPALVILGVLYLTPRKGLLRRALDQLTLWVPVLGKAVLELSLSRYCRTFAITYKAGMPILQCAKLATESVGNAVVQSRLQGGYENIQLGQEMSKGFSTLLPGEFISIWEVGEESGELDQSALRLGNMHAENAERLFTLLARVIPFAIYLVVIAVIAFFIVKGYSKLIYGSISM
ncbi:MAG: type II secretion system F family protein [Planctomycetales bacterium]|nr:type II secretion system F family protein [Planctomycetales bacterium]